MQSDSRSEYYWIHNKRMHLTRIGYGKPIVLVHGWNQSEKAWVRVAPLLAQHFEVISLDLMGCGDSEALNTFTIQEQADCICELCVKMGLKRPLMVGVSLGAYIVLEMRRSNPEMIDGVVLIGLVFRRGTNKITHGLMRSVLTQAKKSPRLTKRVRKLIGSDWFAEFSARFFQMYEYDQKIVEDLIQGRDAIKPKTIIDMGIETTTVKVDSLLVDNGVPMLVVQGTRDKFEKIDRVERVLKGREKYVRLVKVPDCGHTVQLEKPDVLEREIRDFCAHLPLSLS